MCSQTASQSAPHSLPLFIKLLDSSVYFAHSAISRANHHLLFNKNSWPTTKQWGTWRGTPICAAQSQQPEVRASLPYSDILEQNLLTEVLNGHTAGPFPFPPFKHFRISSLCLVPKKHSNKWCTICHLSYPKTSPTSISANIAIEDYTLQYITIDNTIYLLLSLRKVLSCPRQTSSPPSR